MGTLLCFIKTLFLNIVGAVNGALDSCKNFNYIVDVTFSSGTTKHFQGIVTAKRELCPSYVNCKFGNQFDPVICDFNPNLPSGEIGC